ncbi:alpha/beta hydrolase [Erythrobacter sp. F6033]|uniref:alpha/beta fold hydrolase n=1 Tax=Erythrobacter sp. F6033 TaxID=2926401 RepID=UPI001FF4EAE5|nr:alpha/beta hydrolase [Erythrobacter sp. F6033]MCK0127799.1 alpha/beta hydrolase [Erythrobacter sp. F6033]
MTKTDITLRERLRLALQKIEGPAPARPGLRHMLGEATYPLSPIAVRVRPAPQVEKAAKPKIVVMLPGFVATPRTMQYLSHQIERAGHKAKNWKLGFNSGPTLERVEALEQRLLEVRDRYGTKPVLLGWSLGGMFARELAHRQPDAVSKVMTMGSPFSGDPRANNAWRLYQFVAGHPVDAPPIERREGTKPPVETVALWSDRDGVIAPDCARGEAHERDRECMVDCTHMGFSYAPEAIRAVLLELDRD